MKRRALALAILAPLAMAGTGPWPAGTRVRASPLQSENHYGECVVLSGPAAGDIYTLDCDGERFEVAARWIEDLASARPMATVRPDGTLVVRRPPRRSATPPPPAEAAPSRPRQPPGAETPPPPPSPPPPTPPASPPPPTRPPSAGASVAAGDYECWAFGQARLLLNFTIIGPGLYRASDGSYSTFTFDPASGRIAFDGYLKESQPDGFTAVYEVERSRSRVSFRSARGAEAAFCERK